MARDPNESAWAGMSWSPQVVSPKVWTRLLGSPYDAYFDSDHNAELRYGWTSFEAGGQAFEKVQIQVGEDGPPRAMVWMDPLGQRTVRLGDVWLRTAHPCCEAGAVAYPDPCPWHPAVDVSAR